MSHQIDLLIAFIAGWLSRDIYLQIKRGAFWHRSRCWCKWCRVESGARIVTPENPPFVLSDDCESNSITYRAPEVVSHESEPDKCPTDASDLVCILATRLELSRRNFAKAETRISGLEKEITALRETKL